jgi:glutamate-ammonia-ligase adenylyltransferase
VSTLDLDAWGLRDAPRARRNLAALAGHAGALYPALEEALGRALAASPDADLALNNLERLLAQPAASLRLPALLDARGRGLEGLLQLLGVSQFFADTLTTYPEAFDLVRAPPALSASTAELTARLRADVDGAFDDPAVLRAFRRFRHLQMLRIGVTDVLRGRPLEEITRDLARSADASIEVAMQVASRTVSKKYGRPMANGGDEPARLTAFAFGKLGGDELNYSSDIDLMFLYDRDGRTNSRYAPVANSDYFARVVGEVTRLLSSHTDRGFAYRVDLRLRPDGQRGPLARSVAGTLSYYDVRGRTWERQALIKLRHVGGDPALGREFLTAIEPFVYRKYFSFSEINEVKALKRRMEARSTQSGADDLDVKTGRGGIRDIEYTVQFLQLLNGGDLPAVRQRNTLLALEALEIAGCLTGHETYTLADAYRFLRKTEHRLQLLFDWQTHKLPTATEELTKLARRMGYAETERAEPVEAARETTALAAQRRSPLDEGHGTALDTRRLLVEPLDQFLKDFHDKTRVDRAILNHLLHQTFTDAQGEAEPESDLILVQDPDEATVRAVLGRYPFRDVPGAYQNLAKLAQEEVPYLSHRRCRHFLASIAPALLRALAATPDPDSTLNNLQRVTASLGGKAVLYELFSFTPASLKLYVDLCSTSPYLCAILVNNPGMIDELLDTLVLDQRRTPDELRVELAELLRGANDLDPILHSFQDKELLRVGVRDVLGKDDLRETTAAISDIATTLLNGVFDSTEAHLVAKHGTPHAPDGTPCAYAVVALGKLGGREIGYHSDLDLLILYEADGVTHGDRPTTNFQFFTQLAQRGIRVLGEPGPLGRLYQIDMRLRPTGQGGSLVVPMAEFRRYTDAAGVCRLWERQALTRSRVVRGGGAFGDAVMAAVRDAVTARAWCPACADEIRFMREKMEPAAAVRNVKRSPGGLVDIEFLVQLYQLKSGRDFPTILEANIPAALDAIAAAGLIPAATVALLRASYLFLRSVELRVRVVTDRATNEVPEGPGDRAKLAGRMGFPTAAAFLDELTRVTAAVRAVFRDQLAAAKLAPPSPAGVTSPAGPGSR